jgi:hypothetical protein
VEKSDFAGGQRMQTWVNAFTLLRRGWRKWWGFQVVADRLIFFRLLLSQAHTYIYTHTRYVCVCEREREKKES